MAIVAHLTSVHQRNDIRIFLKEARSLSAAGHEVFLIVADGSGDATQDGVRILDAGRPRSRWHRMFISTRLVLQLALKADADIYHLHDPELLLAGLALKRHGKRVIFDAHEDLPRQILSKPYIAAALRKPIAAAMGVFESFACRRFDAVVTATPAIRDKFRKLGISAIDINNVPLRSEFEAEVSQDEKAKEICYVGGITEIRGIAEIVSALELSRSGARLNLAGSFSGAKFKAAVEKLAGWNRVNELGFLTRAQARGVLERSVAGIVTFLPEPNHIDAQPNKMFEYMSAGLPVIGSNFPLWRAIIEGNNCGICVDPQDPRAIANAIDFLVENPTASREMGANGRRAVEERYNWDIEEKKLLELYRKLLDKV